MTEIDLRLAMRQVWFATCGFYIGQGLGLVFWPSVHALRIFGLTGMIAGLMAIILVIQARHEIKEPVEVSP